MKKLWVYADFDWLNHIELMGELIYEQLRGNETFGFKYSEQWLNNHGDIKICASSCASSLCLANSSFEIRPSAYFS